MGVIILGLFSLSLLIKTSYVQQKIIGLIKSSVSKSLGQDLKIEEVDLDVIKGIVLRNVELDIDDKRFLAIDTIRLGYTYSFYD
ncbi:MAG: hypothetical protein GWO07_07650, partial [Candidatus Dadabacteria bacterium]|nr:hypothetical protein [Candidatus Dadabacteria bacterium]